MHSHPSEIFMLYISTISITGHHECIFFIQEVWFDQPHYIWICVFKYFLKTFVVIGGSGFLSLSSVDPQFLYWVIQMQVARNLGKTLRAFQPTIRELQVGTKYFRLKLFAWISVDRCLIIIIACHLCFPLGSFKWIQEYTWAGDWSWWPFKSNAELQFQCTQKLH